MSGHNAGMTRPGFPAMHHVELWLPNLEMQLPCWEWLFAELGWRQFQDWPDGRSWQALDGCYVVIESSPDLAGGQFDRTCPGINHLALTADQPTVDRIAAAGAEHGWLLLFPDLHPWAGGEEHYAAYLENDHGFEVEIVAMDVSQSRAPAE